MSRHITRAKNHVFKDTDLRQVLHADGGRGMLSKTKGGWKNVVECGISV